jgi:mycothiol synthase
MAEHTLQVESLNPRAASEHQYVALNAFENRLRAERLPDDPPIPLDEQVHGWQNSPAFVDMSIWVIWNDDHSAIVAQGTLWLLRTQENQHMAEAEIAVLPDYRRRGYGRRLLASVIELARDANRRLIIFQISDRIRAGEAFMMRLGASRGIESHMNQLDLTEPGAVAVR